MSIVATFCIFSPWKLRCGPALPTVTESIRKWRGPLRTTSVSPSSLASGPASNAFHHDAGHLFRPIVFQTVTVPVGGSPLSSRISQ